MHLFLVTQYYPPEIGAAPSRWGDYVNLLIKKGHKVTVLCQTPNYPKGNIFDGYENKWFNKDKFFFATKFAISFMGFRIPDVVSQ